MRPLTRSRRSSMKARSWCRQGVGPKARARSKLVLVDEDLLAVVEFSQLHELHPYSPPVAWTGGAASADRVSASTKPWVTRPSRTVTLPPQTGRRGAMAFVVRSVLPTRADGQPPIHVIRRHPNGRPYHPSQRIPNRSVGGSPGCFLVLGFESGMRYYTAPFRPDPRSGAIGLWCL